MGSVDRRAAGATGTDGVSASSAPPEFVWSDEQRELRKLVVDFCLDRSPETEVRRVMETPTGYDPVLWEHAGEQLGLLGLAIPELYGGGGAGLLELAVVAEEFGRALTPVPLLGSIGLAATALLAGGDVEAAKDLLPDLAAGRTVGALVLGAGALDAATLDSGATTVTAAPPATADDGWVLHGSVAHVLDGATAGLLVVPARDAGGAVSLFAVADTAGVTREPMGTMDLTRRQGRVTFDGTPARLVGTVGDGSGPVGRALLVGAALLAVEQVGGAERLMRMSVEYAKTRLQFGRPIGSFQAVKHRCADMLVAVEEARSTAYHAVWALQDGSDDPVLATSLAQIVCSEAYVRVAEGTVQIHGGLGFSWEHPAHLYYKRAITDRALLGSPDQHRDRLATAVLD